MRDAWRHFTAEFVGTFILVFIGGGAIIASKSTPGVGLLDVALAHGIALAIGVSATMRISGHLNPSVTIGFVVTRRIEPMMAAVYITGQILGAIAAAEALKLLVPPDQFSAVHGTVQEVSASIGTGQAIALEAIATFFLVFVVFGTAVDPQSPRIGGLAIGMTIAADILAIGPLTGGSMNPARSFGPAVVTSNYYGQFIYWIGPIVGACVAAVLYDTLFLHRGREPVDHGEISR